MRITIGIPTIGGREKSLFSLLVSLLGQTHVEWDLLICTTSSFLNIGSNKKDFFPNPFLANIVQLGHAVTILQDLRQEGPGFAVQQLLDNCSTDYLLRIDDDVVLFPDVIAKLLKTLEEDPVNIAAVAAPANHHGYELIKDYQTYWQSINPFDPGNGLRAKEKLNDDFVRHGCNETEVVLETDFLAGYCLLLDRHKVAQVGGYINENSPHHHKEDYHATLRMREKGFRLLSRMDALAFHRHEGRDYSDIYRSSRKQEDHQLFNQFRQSLQLPPNRKIGLVKHVH